MNERMFFWTLTMQRRATPAALAGAWAVATLGSCIADSPSTEAWRAEVAVWKPDTALPSFPLVDHRGKAFATSQLKGTPTIVAFVFSSCAVASACPLTMTRLREVYARARTAGTQVQFLVVTLDPDRDTPAVLSAFAQKHGVDTPAFRLATGSRDVIDALASLFNVVALRHRTTHGTDSGPSVIINHVVKVAVVNAEFIPVREWLDNNFDAQEVIDATRAE